VSLIEAQDLSYAYAGAQEPAIRGLTFAVQSGEVFGLLGPSGAGKSTTQKVLIGLLRGYRGRVAAFGRDLSAWGPDYYERIGVSFELPNHFLKLTARENLAFFASLYKRPTLPPEAVLEMVDLGGDAGTLVGRFSKGMLSRLTVARSLLHDPDLLFLDEPTSGLDPVNARRISNLIRAQQQAGKTIFLTTHNMTAAAELCDRVAFVVDGQITLIDSPHALMLQHGRPTVRVEYLPCEDVPSPQVAPQPAGVYVPAVREFPLDGLAENQPFLDLLRAGKVQTLHTQEATLEEVFIGVTGRSLS
jgi:fluoroquinolone transport system ATP-binding protein